MSPNKRRMNASLVSSSSSFKMSLTGAGAILLLLLLSFICSSQITDARYLPTRADETEVNILKNLIKEILAESASNQVSDWQMNRVHGGAKPVLGQLVYQRRSAEIPQFAVSDTAERSVAGAQVE